MMPRSGDVLHIGKEASVQFMAPMHFRVIRLHDWPTYDGWVWIDGYELNSSGDAVERRSIFVQIAGLRHVPTKPRQAPRRSKAVNVGPVVPRPRISPETTTGSPR